MRASVVVNGPTKVLKEKPGIGNRAEDCGIEPQAGQVLGAALVAERAVNVGQERGFLFQGAGLRLLKSFACKLDAGAALG